MEEFQVESWALRAEVESLADQFASMIRPPVDTSMRVPDSEWTIGEHAAHLADAQRGFAAILNGELVEHRGNAHQLAHFTDRDGAVLADGIVDWTRDLLKAAAGNEGIDRKHPGFSPETMTQWTSYSMCHILMHSAPVTRALGFPSPVGSCHLGLALPFFQVVMPSILDRSEAAGVCGRIGIQATDGPSFCLSLEDGELVVEPSIPASVECCIKASAATIFSVSLGLETESSAIERGDWVVSGIDPELGKSFKRLLPNP